MNNDHEQDWNPKTWSEAIDEIYRLTEQRDQNEEFFEDDHDDLEQ